MGTFFSRIRALGGLTLPTAVPPTPGPGENAIYFKTDGRPYYKNSSGLEVPFAPEPPGLIPNASFENWSGGKPAEWGSYWRDNGSPSWEWIQSTDAAHGSYALRVDIPANKVGNGSTQSSNFSVSPGDIVTIKAWAKTTSTAQTPQLSLELMTAVNPNPSYFDPLVTNQGQYFNLSTLYTQKSVSFTVPAGHQNATISIVPTKALATAAAQVFIDNVTVEVVTPPATQAPPPIIEAVGANLTTPATTGIQENSALPGIAFVAPPSGRVMVTVSAYLRASVANAGIIISSLLRSGGTIGSGTLVTTGNAYDGAANYGVNYVRSQGIFFYEGLTPGSTYNARMTYQNASGSGHLVSNPFIKVVPQ